jgi:hypothetical protein
VLRFQEIGGAAVAGIRLTTPIEINEAVVANTLENAAKQKIDLSSFSLKPWETLTVLIRVNPRQTKK